MSKVAARASSAREEDRTGSMWPRGIVVTILLFAAASVASAHLRPRLLERKYRTRDNRSSPRAAIVPAAGASGTDGTAPRPYLKRIEGPRRGALLCEEYEYKQQRDSSPSYRLSSQTPALYRYAVGGYHAAIRDTQY